MRVTRLLGLLAVGGLAYVGIAWWTWRTEMETGYSAPQPAIPQSAQGFSDKANRIRSLHEKKRPNQPGDWLDRFPEGGQTFAQYIQSRHEEPLRDSYSSIDIQPLGEFDETQLQIVKKTQEFMECFFGVPVRLLQSRALGEIPSHACRTRNEVEQVLTTWILDDILKPDRSEDAMAVIGLVTCDLWPGDLNWVFGSASLHERVGVWSLHRNGDPRASDEAFRLCLRRTLKTAVHETGHMLGIPHCAAYECCMNGSRSREECDRQPLEFCPECQPKIWWSCRADPVKRCQQLFDFAEREGLKPEAEFWRRELKFLSNGIVSRK